MIVAIQQPEHAPWMGFFNKMAQVDLYVLLDNVQYKKRYFENRNKIRTSQSSQWVTVPIVSKGRYHQWINQVEIDNAQDWQRKYVNSIISAYSKAPCFDCRQDDLLAILNRPWDMLVDLNIALIEYFASLCKIQTPIKKASDLNTGETRGSDLIFEICKQTEASVYVSGPDGRNYLNLEHFLEAGIKLVYHDFEHPEYSQLHRPFQSHMSLIDFIFNVKDVHVLKSCYSL
jgi:hypothetical protein